MEQSFKTFSDLKWYNNKGRDDAELNFENGYGVHIWKDGKITGTETWFYGGALLFNGDLHYSKNYHPLQWGTSLLTHDDITQYMKKIQELSLSETPEDLQPRAIQKGIQSPRKVK